MWAAYHITPRPLPKNKQHVLELSDSQIKGKESATC